MAKGRASSSKPSASSERSALVGSLLKTALTSELAALTGCSVSWKASTTPAGRSWLVATTSAPIMSGSAPGSLVATSPNLPTPVTPSNSGGLRWEGGSGGRKVLKASGLWGAIHSTPKLPTPMASDGMKDGAGGGAGSTYPFRKILATPRKTDADRGFRGDVLAQLQNQNNRHAGMMQEALPTPTKRDKRMDRWSPAYDKRKSSTMDAVLDGAMTDRSPDKWAYARQIASLLSSTGLTGPSMTLPVTYGWMMGYPPGWLSNALRSAVLAGRLPLASSSKRSATPSSRKSQKQ